MAPRPIAVITASTAGIGLAIADALARDNYHVVISSRRAANVQAAITELRRTHGTTSASGLVCHVGRPEDRQRLLSHVQSLLHPSTATATNADGQDKNDIDDTESRQTAEGQQFNTPHDNNSNNHGVLRALICNAASSTAYGPLLETSDAAWDKMFDVNVRSTFQLIKMFYPLLQPHGQHSSIILISSVAAYRPLPNLGAYSVTKAALVALTKVLAGEIGGRNGIRVNGVAPGIIRTEFSRRLWEGEEEGKGKGKGGVLTSRGWRVGEAKEIGEVVAFLVSERAAYVSGEIMVVDGGMMSKL